jgi:hypothetical protein
MGVLVEVTPGDRVRLAYPVAILGRSMSLALAFFSPLSKGVYHAAVWPVEASRLVMAGTLYARRRVVSCATRPGRTTRRDDQRRRYCPATSPCRPAARRQPRLAPPAIKPIKQVPVALRFAKRLRLNDIKTLRAPSPLFKTRDIHDRFDRTVQENLLKCRLS